MDSRDQVIETLRAIVAEQAQVIEPLLDRTRRLCDTARRGEILHCATFRSE